LGRGEEVRIKKRVSGRADKERFNPKPKIFLPGNVYARRIIIRMIVRVKKAR